MATNFPSSLDVFTNPTSTSSMSGALSHAGQHSDLNDAVEALQAKVGADSSAVTSSHDYKIADHASRLTTLEGATTGSLVLVASTSVSAVSSVSIDGCFTTNYNHYLVVMTGTAAASATHEIRLRYRASAITETGAVYVNNILYLNTGGSAAGVRYTGDHHTFSSLSTTGPTDGYANIFRPFVSGATTGFIGQGAGTLGNSVHVNGNNTSSTTQYDGVHFYHATGGTFTADFYVYGIVT